MSLHSERNLLRILFVEDNEYLRTITAELLERKDRKVVACESAEQALDEFQRTPFDVLITDLSLPVMSGMELAKHVLKIAPAANIIISSGYPLKVDLQQLGPNVRTLPKPFETEQLELLLNTFRSSVE